MCIAEKTSRSKKIVQMFFSPRPLLNCFFEHSVRLQKTNFSFQACEKKSPKNNFCVQKKWLLAFSFFEKYAFGFRFLSKKKSKKCQLFLGS